MGAGLIGKCNHQSHHSSMAALTVRSLFRRGRAGRHDVHNVDSSLRAREPKQVHLTKTGLAAEVLVVLRNAIDTKTAISSMKSSA